MTTKPLNGTVSKIAVGVTIAGLVGLGAAYFDHLRAEGHPATLRAMSGIEKRLDRIEDKQDRILQWASGRHQP